ncbi:MULTISPECIES: fimbrial protein [Providencia]|uniref:fimbrial protein n=1 Tax=Providencia TaxID=586 RepID=UPI000D9F07CC|nr:MULTISPECIES: fimbrial protein [Providencia]CAG9407666.1 Protein FimF [Providencia alcalifaciens]SPY76171.1 fimbrial protein [Providencia rustigianii]
MKNQVIASLIATSTLLISAHSFAKDGDINFTGEITDNACQLATGSDAIQVNLGKVSKNSLSNTGSTTAATKFSIQLEKCPAAVTSATVKFDGVSYAGNSSVLQLTNAGTSGIAEGVGIQIQDAKGITVPLYTASNQYALKETVVNNLDFTARYIAMTDAVGAGLANSTATFTINYN